MLKVRTVCAYLPSMWEQKCRRCLIIFFNLRMNLSNYFVNIWSHLSVIMFKTMDWPASYESNEKLWKWPESFVQCYMTRGNDFLKKIVVGDETWIRYKTSETKQQSLEWRLLVLRNQKNKKQNYLFLEEKLCSSYFGTYKETLLVNWMERGRTINYKSRHNVQNWFMLQTAEFEIEWRLRFSQEC